MSSPRPRGPAAGSRAPEFRAARGLAYLGGFFAYGLGLSALYAAAGIGLPCPFRALTGWDCPLCGGTRLGSALLQGDLGAAFGYNPLVLIGLAVLAVLAVAWLVEAVGGPRLRLPVSVATRLGRIRPTGWLLVGLSIGLVYTLARNLL